MLFKISMSNIRKSMKDYAIYFFTLIIGVAVFYIFNAIESQTAFLNMNEDRREMIRFLTTAISGVSVFVAIVLGLLIVYASRFLMKRRNKEFALYMMLGMSKWKISALLLCETVIIGAGSLFVGLLIGVGLSQIMSAVVANLFEADMSNYRFTVSASAIVKTVLYFGIMYVVVIIRSGFVISRCRLITLMNSGKRSEKITMKNTWVCMIVFILSAVVLGYAYYMVGWNQWNLNTDKIITAIIMGAVATFFIFWSVAGMLLRVIMSVKGVYHKGLNSFTFRQISSKVNTTVASMTVICLMLFLTICTLSTAFIIRNSMNEQIEKNFPIDFFADYGKTETIDGDEYPLYSSIDDEYSQKGLDIRDEFSEYHNFHVYYDREFTLSIFIGDAINDLNGYFESFESAGKSMEPIMKLSDYNALMKLYGKKTIELKENEYALCASFEPMVDIYDRLFSDKHEITLFGNTLANHSHHTIKGYIAPKIQPINTGMFIVPDSIIDEAKEDEGLLVAADVFAGNYKSSDKKETEKIEKEVLEKWKNVMGNIMGEDNVGYSYYTNTRIEAANSAVGVSALVTFLGLYIGFVFLVSCGAILALKELSESVDSMPRYTMLRKLGVEEKDITKSIFLQTGIFFLLPLLLACLHSYFGMRLGKFGLDMVVVGSFTKPMFFTAAVVVLIYGGYFLLTFFGSKSIVKEQK
ncbi:MAG: ABC transporter permease [Ruminococcus sp.]|uniref:FtsX-like permease family protein n=1 Tax=Ruminococcus sp. TaxID=41978 RepID=UPI0025E54F54|nr:ABC transporter permease [Ruminococcus sp.]MCR4794138.1 ABC transporter permease [Ruminococcus sp.]